MAGLKTMVAHTYFRRPRRGPTGRGLRRAFGPGAVAAAGLALALALAAGRAGAAGGPPEVVIEAQSPLAFDPATGIATATNGVTVKYGNMVMTANEATWNEKTQEIQGRGAVKIQKDNQVFSGDELSYNYSTQQITGGAFRSGHGTMFLEGAGLAGDQTNDVFAAYNGYMTTDDYADPLVKIRAKSLTLIPGEYFAAREATLYINGVPVFYFPYYRHSLKRHPNNWVLLPGYRSSFGPYLLSTYNWYYSDAVEGAIHLDWREQRGPGLGPDLGLHLGEYGEVKLKYYYTHDSEPNYDNITTTVPISENRQRLFLSYDSSLRTNLTIKGQVAYLSDPLVTHDFFESEYRKNIQPNTFFDVNQAWSNWSLDTIAQPRVNPFFETVERLPEVRLSGFRQQILDTPFYYESESSAGYFRRLFANTNGVDPNYSAARADTFHQVTMPETFFGWLTFTPRAGARFTSYSEETGPGAATTQENREVYNTGAEVATKLSRVWPGYENHFLDMDGARHIMEPSINYAFVPRPNVPPGRLPQFDYDLTNSFALQPIEYPDYNSIDSINSENVLRYGVRNRWQTKRDGEVQDVVDWRLYLDWHLASEPGINTFSDIYSDLSFRPRTWLTFNSQTRYDINDGWFNLARHSVTFQPDSTWSWTLGHFYLRDGSVFGVGNELITSGLFYRLNDNWGLRMTHYYDVRDGFMQEQDYSIYRDLRSWTGALTFRVRENLNSQKDYTVAVTFSVKAFPRFGVGQDTVSHAALTGY